MTLNFDEFISSCWLIGTTRIRKKIDSFINKAEKEMA